jgi:hypothetical protein
MLVTNLRALCLLCLLYPDRYLCPTCCTVLTPFQSLMLLSSEQFCGKILASSSSLALLKMEAEMGHPPPSPIEEDQTV